MPAAPAPSVALVRRPAAARVVAVGDLHGDLSATRAVLRAAKVLGDGDGWSGGATVLVQTGDILDRGDDEPDILALLERLGGEARAAGGDVILLNGNHELMNGAGDFRYVTQDGFADYDGERGRAQAFAPGGAAAKHLATFPIYAIVGDTVFVHGGVEPEAAVHLGSLDAEARAWLAGTASAGPPLALTDSDGPVWSRRYGRGESAEVCADARAALAALGVARMVIGHTPQEAGISSICGGTVWRIDTGLAAHYGGKIQALELTGAAAQILEGQR